MNALNALRFFRIVITTSILFYALSGCVMNGLDAAPKTIVLRETLRGIPVRVEIEKGEAWSRRMQAGPFVFNVLPQIVIWAEDGSGRLVDTLFITGAGKATVGNAAKTKKGAAFYAECFPVWALKLKDAGGKLPDRETPYPDTITSATPSNSFTVRTKLPESQAATALFLEINQSADVNAAFTEKNNDWVGQPSLVYKAALESREPGTEYGMKLAGHGGRLDEPAAVYDDLSGFDTALNQIREIKISFE